MPLQQTLRICETAVLLGVRCGREEEDFRAYICRLDFTSNNLGRLTPEICCFGQLKVADDKPVECAKALALKRSIHGADYRVLAHDEITLDKPIHLVDHR